MANQIPQTKQSNIYFQTDEEAIKALEAEGRKLKYIALKVWRKYLSSYQPKAYVRTRKSQRGIKLGKVKSTGTNSWGIELTFENDLMYHDSYVGDDQPKGHSIMLLSSGWTATNLEKKIGVRKNFTRHKGIDYLGEVAKAYNQNKDKGVTLEIQWSGQYLKEK